ncbi:MAG: hypothetical protein O7B99_06610 [Planctomycetota bacterium]|nr:hypothetical protein [Planctomycetota bacterium]
MHAEAVKSQLRFHRGVSGRGEGFFTDEQRAHLARLVRSYERIDFRERGLT